jgi:glycosyltransferase involved in cell wall biosynthesis
MRLSFLLPGDPATRTGGYGYDRAIVSGLRATGWVVHQPPLPDGFPWPGAAARAAAERVVSALPDGMLVVADGLAFGVLPALAEQHADRLRWVALVHHPLALETGLSEAQREVLADSERRALACARLVIVTSAATARALHAYGVPARRIRVVPPGTAPVAAGPRPDAAPPDAAARADAAPPRPAAAMPVAAARHPAAPRPDAVARSDAALPGQAAGPSDAPTIAITPTPRPPLALLCVATLTPRKGQALLVEALAGLRDLPWTLHCAGSTTRDAPTAAAVCGLIERHGLVHRVHLHGELDEAALDRLYRQSDAAVLATSFEGYGMALAEAMAHGLPVVSTTAGAIPDLVPPSAGLLVPPDDVHALRQALAELLDDAALRARLSDGALAAARTLPTWDQSVAAFAAALDEVGGVR